MNKSIQIECDSGCLHGLCQRSLIKTRWNPTIVVLGEFLTKLLVPRSEPFNLLALLGDFLLKLLVCVFKMLVVLEFLIIPLLLRVYFALHLVKLLFKFVLHFVQLLILRVYFALHVVKLLFMNDNLVEPFVFWYLDVTRVLERNITWACLDFLTAYNYVFGCSGERPRFVV